LAVRLAGDPKELTDLRQTLAANRLTMPLFDTRLFTRHLEEGYTRIYDRYQADLPADHTWVTG
jgi:predicted O-linked N-acetylglucosamine transferase (SPINDLY family)